jgi:prepilin-type N-terminal cleavage/methylation domain-containing protein
MQLKSLPTIGNNHTLVRRVVMKRSRGFTLIELLIVIGIVLVVLGGFAAAFLSESKRKTCTNQLGKVQDATKIALQHRNDRTLCLSARTLTEEFNKDCGDDLGKLQLINCPD